MTAHGIEHAQPAFARQTRDRLILEHMAQVKLIARRIHKGLPPSIPLDDLISAGVIGLIAAIDRYDVQLEVKLKTYAEYKIRGAILDSLRVLDWIPRLQRKRTKLLESAVFELLQQMGHPPGDEEIAGHLGISLDEYQGWKAGAKCQVVGSLEASVSEEDERQVSALVADAGECLPSEIFARSEMRALLEQALRSVPPVERRIITLHFFEGMTLRDIAKMVDLHESRISQLKSQATARLKTYLNKRSVSHLN